MLRYKEIKKLIINQATLMEPNEKLPSRAEMCKQYQVSRTTVDRAIEELISEGYLYATNGSGTFVDDFTVNKVSLLKDVLNIGFLVPNILHDTYPGILRGIEDEMQKHSINVVICNTDNDYTKQHTYLKRLINSRIDGLIIVPPITNNYNDLIFPEMEENQVPFVLCNRPIYGIQAPLVCSNNYYGGFLATQHLIQNGYRNIAYIMPLHYDTSIARYNGYLAALQEYGIPFDPELVYCEEKPSTVEMGYELIKKLYSRRPDINGVFCFNDRIACGVINAIKELGLRVSEDIGVIGYDDTELCNVPAEKLTSVSFRNYEIGNQAAKLILQMIKTPKIPIDRLTIFCPEICSRESCKGFMG